MVILEGGSTARGQLHPPLSFGPEISALLAAKGLEVLHTMAINSTAVITVIFFHVVSSPGSSEPTFGSLGYGPQLRRL